MGQAGAGARFVNIGERCNVTGSARFKKLILAGDYAKAVEAYLRAIATQMDDDLTLLGPESDVRELAAARGIDKVSTAYYNVTRGSGDRKRRGGRPGDPMAGLLPFSDRASGGLGLWITAQSCSHVVMEQTPQGYTIWLTAGDPHFDPRAGRGQ